MNMKITRRNMMKTSTLALATMATAQLGSAAEPAAYQCKGKVRQSLSRWCLGKTPLEELCKQGKTIGLVGLDLIQAPQWETVIKNGMIVTMGSMPKGGIPKGFNRTENHGWLVEMYEEYIPMAAKLGVPNLICMSGNREGMDDETAIKNCITGLKKIMPTAEKYKVTIQMELLNSKDHVDYQCDHTAWGAEVCHGVGSDRFKLLYDIYHMQRMEGDIIANIRKFHDCIGHYHTGGNPGRQDLDDQQELYYPSIMKAILATGYTGFVAHEFVPKNGIDSVAAAVKLCDV